MKERGKGKIFNLFSQISITNKMQRTTDPLLQLTHNRLNHKLL